MIKLYDNGVYLVNGSEIVDGRLMFLLSNSLFARIIIKISAIPGGSVMKNSEELRQQLRSINRKSYPAYKGLKGLYHFGNYILSIDHVQGDPFASPSHVSIQISHRDTGFPVEYYKDTLTGTTLCDYLTRQFEKQVSQYSFRAKGSGKSGLLTASHCGQ